MEPTLKLGNFQAIDKRLVESEAITELRERADQQLENSIPWNTTRAYQADLEQFRNWTVEHKRATFPTDPETVRLYVAALAERGLAPASISRKLTAIRMTHEAAGFDNPVTKLVRDQFRAYCRERGTAQQKARPLVAADLRAICALLKPDVLDTRDRALLLVGYAGALRRSELTALVVSDLEFTDDGIRLLIRRSKTDQLGGGIKIGIPRLNESPLCPVRALDKWLSLTRIAVGPIFRAVGKHGKDVFFKPVGDTAIDDKVVSAVVKKRAGQIGHNPALYSAHSLRAGWCTDAARIGLTMAALQQHTRHKSERVAAGYIRESNVFNVNPLSMMLGV